MWTKISKRPSLKDIDYITSYFICYTYIRLMDAKNNDQNIFKTQSKLICGWCLDLYIIQIFGIQSSPWILPHLSLLNPCHFNVSKVWFVCFFTLVFSCFLSSSLLFPPFNMRKYLSVQINSSFLSPSSLFLAIDLLFSLISREIF